MSKYGQGKYARKLTWQQEEVLNALRALGPSKTRKVWEHLCETSNAPTALGTVYNQLANLKAKGLVDSTKHWDNSYIWSVR